MQIDKALCAKRLLQAEDILILTHKDPDGDTIGGAFALYWTLTALDKRVRVVCPDEMPPRFDYLYPSAQADFAPAYIVAVDVADPRLLGKLSELANRVDLCIDHHPTNTGYARETLLEPACASATELIFAVLEDEDIPISPLAATALYTGLSSDTGSFRYQNTTAASFAAAARLLELGADHMLANERIFGRQSRAMVAAQSRAAAAMRFYLDGKCAVLRLPRSLLEETGATDEELEGISETPRRVAGVAVGVVLRERPAGTARLSLRSTDNTDVSVICRSFGGGGHLRAAGCTLDMPLDEAENAIVAAVEAQLKKEGLI